MKRIIFISILMTIFLLSTAFCANTIKLGVNVTAKSHKDNYKKGDIVIVELTIDEACENLGFIMGTLDFDLSQLSFNRANKGDIEVYSPIFKGYDHIQTKYLDVGVDNHKNQVIFWMEDDQNRIKEGNIGSIAFNVEKDIKEDELSFKLNKLQASDYELKNTIKVEQSSKSTAEVIKQTKEEASKGAEELSDLKEKVEKETKETVEQLTNPSNNKSENKKDNSTNNQGNSSKSQARENKKSNEEKVKDSSKKSPKWTNNSSWVLNDLEEADSKGLIPETLQNMDFTKPINRRNFAAVAVKLYEYFSGKKIESDETNPFTDVDDEYVTKAYSVGITEGTNKEKGLFSPNAEITREQMATMIVRALNKLGIDTKAEITLDEKFVDDDEIHSWGRDAIYFMFKKGIIKGISSHETRFGVKNNATIEQAIAIALRCQNTLKK